MNAQQKPTALELYRAEVLPPHKAQDLFQSLPAHIKPAVFERNLLNALMANPDLMQFHPGLVYREVAKAAGLGLLLDPLLGEAYIVVAYNYKTSRKEPQLRVGYKGTIKLARQTGNVTTISCHEVHAHDEVDVDLGFPKMFHHRPKLFTERGPIMGYVALIGFKDGTFDFEPMSVAQCQAIRDRSDAWRAFKENKIKSTPWSTDEGEMSKKTALRRLLKRQEQSPELVRANQIEDEAEFEHIAPPQRVERIEGPPAPANDESGPPVPAEEATAVEVVEEKGPPAPAEDFPGDKPVAKAAVDDLDIPDYLRRTPDKPKYSKDEQDWLDQLEAEFADCETMEALSETQRGVMTPWEGSVPTETWNAACEIMDKHVERVQAAG